MGKVEIVIPLYKEKLNKFETISFRRSLEVFSKYEFALIIPEGFNSNIYTDLLKAYNIAYKEEYFAKEYFESVFGYNKLLLSKEFYKRFLKHEFILIYQLDCYVFRDELEKWCNYNFDYIGSPWYTSNKNRNHFFAVGNGGFSLRKPDKLLEFLDSKSLKMNLKGIIKMIHNQRSENVFFKFPRIIIRLLGFKNSKSYYIHKARVNEDIVFGFISQYVSNKLNTAPENLALQFSFDKNPDLQFRLNNNNLPFGCHAWFTYVGNLSFWKQYIEIENDLDC
jgi:hypothetical protein